VIGVTGATGRLGGRVARRLAEAGTEQRLIVRDPARAPRLDGATVASAAYGHEGSLARAFDGIQTLLLVSATESADRVSLHKTTVDAAVRAGVERIVYTSFLGAAPEATFTFARDHWHTEEHIRSSGAGFTFLRDSLYLDFVPHMVGDDDVIRGPAGDGRLGAVTLNDVADVAAAVLTSADHAGGTYDVTGPEAFSLADAAAVLSSAWGRPIRYHAETIEEAYRSRERYGAPPWEVAGWVTSYAAIAAGELDVVSDTVDRVAGHRPTSLAEYLRRT
jgi:NAD(P)H dehydrogenase (quinone)